MTETSATTTPDDRETEFPPRFKSEFIAFSALVLLAVFVGVSGWIRDVFDAAGLLDKARADVAENVAAYVLFIAGLLALLAALVFALVEARSPKPSSTPIGSQEVNSAKTVKDVVEAFEGRRMSRVLLAIGFVFILLAAAGSGLVDVSLGDGDGATTPTTTTTTPTTTSTTATTATTAPTITP